MIERDVITVSGPDALTYLQGQVSQDLRPMEVGDRRWTFLLQPTGKIDVLAGVVRTGEQSFTFDTDAGFGEALAARLARFKIRVQADIGPVETVQVDGLDDAGRIAAGWPAMGTEIVPGETIPAETGITPVAVDFRKGCYPGQELVERMDSRGAAAPRRLRLLDVPEGSRPGDPVEHEGQVVGTLTTVVGRRALGYVKRGADLGDPLPSAR